VPELELPMTTRGWVAVLGALTALATALRVVRLDAGLWYDEIVTLVEFVRPSLLHIVTAFPDTNNHPLYSVLAHLSVGLFGENAWSLRFPAMIFGVASVPMLYWLGTEVSRRVEAMSAAALLAVSYHGIWFSQNARGYTALLFWTMLATRIIIRLRQSPGPRLATAYGIVAALGVYTHLTMGFVIAGHAMVWALWRPERPTSTRRHLEYLALAFTLAGVLSAAFYAPMLEQVFQYMSRPPTASTAVATPSWAVVEVLKGLRVGLGTIGVVGAAAFALVGVASVGRESRATLLLFLMPGIVTLAGVIAMRAPLRPRFFFSFLGFALLFLVRGAMETGTYIARRWAAGPGSAADAIPKLGQRVGLSVVTVIVLLSLGAVRYAYAFPKQDFDGALEFLRDRRTELEPVGTAGLASYPYARYYRQPWSQIETREQFDRLRASGERTWMVYSFPEYIEPRLVESLRQHCTVERAFHGTLDGGDVIVCSVRGR
jgi:mannosyltransferase